MVWTIFLVSPSINSTDYFPNYYVSLKENWLIIINKPPPATNKQLSWYGIHTTLTIFNHVTTSRLQVPANIDWSNFTGSSHPTAKTLTSWTPSCVVPSHAVLIMYNSDNDGSDSFTSFTPHQLAVVSCRFLKYLLIKYQFRS